MTETCKEFELCMTNHSALKEFEQNCKTIQGDLHIDASGTQNMF